MLSYPEFLTEIKSFADENYKSFHKKLLKNDSIAVLGVCVPDLRRIAKKYRKEYDIIMSFPDEYYEVTFIKLTVISYLEYEELIKYIDKCIPLIDNWATCDCFTPKTIIKHKAEFLPYLEKYINTDKEFYQRFALTTLLHFYVEEEFKDVIFKFTDSCNTQYYYVHMAAAWLVAETLVKFYDIAKDYLIKNTLDKRTHNKAIQKARESFRLSEEQKNFLKGIKR